MNRSKAKGTSWESAIVDYLRGDGWPAVERRALGGAKDRGDIAGIPGVVIEAKSAARLALAAWLAEAEVERVNDVAEFAVVWAKRKGKTSPGAGYVIMSGEHFAGLLALARREWRST